MKSLKKWGLPVLTGLVVLAAVVLPRQISFLQDLRTLGAVHIEPLSEEDLNVREIPLPEKLELLGRAIRYPDLEVFSTTQSLPAPGQSGADQVEEVFIQSVEFLVDWGVLPKSFDIDTLEFLGGSRALYVWTDGYQSVSMLYLQGQTDNRDSFWLVVDEETGLPVWIDCTLRSSKKDFLTSEELGKNFLDGLGLKTQQRGPAMWEVEGTGGLVYSARIESTYGHISVEPLGFAAELFGEEETAPSAESK